MAENASTVFNVHVPEFVDAIWVALRDPALPVRERAVDALRACLRVIEKRETRWRVQWLVLAFKPEAYSKSILQAMPPLVILWSSESILMVMELMLRFRSSVC